MGQGLDNVRNFYMEDIAGADARAAVFKYTGHRYTQHSTGVRDGADMVRRTSDIDREADTEVSKAVVLEYTKQVLQEGGHNMLD